MANAGATGQVCDGVDIAPLLRGQKSLEREAIYWHYPHYSDQGGPPAGAMREGDWKLIEFYEDGHLELYNLALDPGEQYDFASTFSGRAEQMRRKLETWREGVNALMPKPNPEYNPMLAKVHAGPVGCSWDASAECKED
jgi:arylsulfatase A-like enzyme